MITLTNIASSKRSLMKFAIVAMIAVTFFIILPRTVSADVVLALDTAGGTSVETGGAGAGKLLRIYISSDSSDEIQALAPTFNVQAGSVTSGVVSIAGGTGTVGFFGAGNLTVSDFVKSAETTFVIDQFLTAPQTLMNAADRELWFELTIDTSGLASGSYFLQLDDPGNSFFDSASNALATNNDLVFSVSAVPEPGSLSVLGLASILLVARRRRLVG